MSAITPESTLVRRLEHGKISRALCLEAGDRIAELEAKLEAYESIIIEMGEDTGLGSAAQVNVAKRVALEYYDRLEALREQEG